MSILNENETSLEEAKRNNLSVYPLHEGFFCSMSVDNVKIDSTTTNVPQTVIILDTSGSMGNNVEKLKNEVFPAFFNKLAYDPEALIHLITFDNKVGDYHCKVKDLKHLQIKAYGGTYMTGALNKLKKLFKSFEKSRPLRLLTVSDGAINDQHQAMEAGTVLANFVSLTNTPINSQAVRLFTSENQPDTGALCSLLQLNNSTSSQLLDITSTTSVDEMALRMAGLFNGDGLLNGCTLTAESPIFYKFPWELKSHKTLNLSTGQNIFWLNEAPSEVIKFEGVAVDIQFESSFSLAKFRELHGLKFDYIIDHIKVLKIVGTQEAADTAKRILEYFTKSEKVLATTVEGEEESSEDLTKLSHRVQKTIKMRQKNICHILAKIVNDDKVSQLNSAQKADYLRKINVAKSGRGLAKRAAKEGLSFDEIARFEVHAMANHFDELKDIDDLNHADSFFSQETTFGGIRSLVEASKDASFESFTVNDILQLINIVGVACSGPIGDFPDPMTWKVDEIFPGCNISLSDVLVGYNQSKGCSLTVPGIGKEITNVIPFFDDPKIGNFLKNYASSLLEYTFSVGMRRVIADVPMTIGYTMSAGIWKMVIEMDKNKSSIHLEVFEKFVSTFDSFVGKYFDHVSQLLKIQGNEKFSFYIGYNGVRNIMSPLIRAYKTSDEEKLKLIPKILRALYTFEIWQSVRRSYKSKPDSDEIAKSMLHKLLGIDLDKYKTSVKPLFTIEPKLEYIKFYDKPMIDENFLAELCKQLYTVNFLTTIPKYFEAAVNGPLESIKSIPVLNMNYILESLEIDYFYKLFLFFNVFQALRYTTRAQREDSINEKMKIVDVKNKHEAMNDVKGYVREQFKAQYLSELAAKRNEEKTEMGEIIAEKILSAITYSEMISMWRDGIKLKKVSYKIESPSSPGFKTLCNKLWESSIIKQWTNIFKVLLLGVDDTDQAVWNHGGVCFFNTTEMATFKTTYLDISSIDQWNSLMMKFKATGMHKYRENINRHGHGNSKPSFAAMGYRTIHEYQKAETEEEFQKYCKAHSGCCGVRHLKINT